MPNKPRRFCQHPGCGNLADGQYCSEHANSRRPRDNRRNAGERGYDLRWQRFRDWYLEQPGNQFCKLHISPGCTVVADCIDHIRPLELGGEKYDLNNLQPACLRCNTVKGQREIRGTWEFGKG